MGWMPRKVSGSRRIKEWVLAFARISKGPRNLLESLWDGQVVQKNLALMKACSPTVKFGAGDLFALAGALIMELGFGNCGFKFLV